MTENFEKVQTEEGDEIDVYTGDPDDLPRAVNGAQDDIEVEEDETDGE